MFEFDSLDDCIEIVHSKEIDPVEDLAAAVEDRNYPAAYSALRRLDGSLSGEKARDCLRGALSCTPQLFGAILERCEPKEYAETNFCVPHPEREDRVLLVSGTVLTLAAAKNKPRHMELLLEKGWDVNSAAPASEQALYDVCDGRSWDDWRREDSSIACITQHNDFKPVWEIPRVTPLAAAIIAGSTGAVRLLKSHGGAMGVEHPSVGCAAVLALHGTQRQRVCLRLALGLHSRADDTDGMRRELLVNHAPELEVVASYGTTEEFALRISAAPCPPEGLRAAAELLLSDADGKEKLFLLLDRFPALEAEQSVRNRILDGIVSRMLAGQPCDALLERLQRGGMCDLTGLDRSLVVEIAGRDANELQAILSRLGEGAALCAEAEKAWLFPIQFPERFSKQDKRLLDVWLDCVQIYRASGYGISFLTRALLRANDTRLLRKAAACGALRGERREELLAKIRAFECSGTLRALVLTLPEGQINVESARPQPESTEAEWWQRLSVEEETEFLRQIWTQPVGAEECRRRLQHIGWGSGETHLPIRLANEMDGINITGIAAAACCGRNPELLQLLLESGAAPEKRIKIRWGRLSEELKGTMLCLAAAAGRTEQVRLLLERGMDPNENDVSERSAFCESIFDVPRVVTPLFMALKKGQYETALLLESYGAYAYPAVE